VLAYGARLSLQTMGQTIAELTWLPVGVTYASLPLGAFLTLLFVIERRWVGPQHHRRLMRYEENPSPEQTAQAPTAQGVR
jgi:TRAP-type C4-dicarboxylate transport system permease small subunit